MVNTMTQAGNGILALPKGPIPAQLTPLKVFELLVNSERTKIIKVASVFAEYIRAGQMPNEQDLEFNQKMEETMQDSSEVEGLDELNLNDPEHHPLALFIAAQNNFTSSNKDGFKNSLSQFMQSIQLHTMALAQGQLNPQNIDGFMQKLSLLGESDIQRFRERVNPSEKVQLTKVEEIIEIEEEQITVVVQEDTQQQTTEKPHVVLITDSQADKEADEQAENELKSQEEAPEEVAAADDNNAVEIPVVIEIENTENPAEATTDDQDGPIITVVEQAEQPAEKTEDVPEGQDNIQQDE